jgi:hypothetical protein
LVAAVVASEAVWLTVAARATLKLVIGALGIVARDALVRVGERVARSYSVGAGRALGVLALIARVAVVKRAARPGAEKADGTVGVVARVALERAFVSRAVLSITALLVGASGARWDIIYGLSGQFEPKLVEVERLV